MKRLKNNQTGFSAVEALLILVIIGLIGFVGWYVYDANKDTDKNLSANSSTETVAADSGKLNKSYTNEFGHFSVKYPGSWKLKTEKADDHGQKASLTSPSGVVLNLNSDLGGRGGYCEPAPTDKPFQADNACASKEYLSADKLPNKTVYTSIQKDQPDGSIDFEYKLSNLYLVTSHTANQGEADSYSVGISDVYSNAPLALNKAEMGLFTPIEYFTVYNANGDSKPYVYAYASGESEQFLKSADAKIIKNILKTLKVELN